MLEFVRRSPSRKNLELASLSAMAANVMIADAQMNITYINPALKGFMEAAEKDIQEQLPSFKASKLIGSNIDIFHKNPLHQRRMLDKLTAPHAATIKVGKRIFDLFVTPLEKNAICIGYVVEWSDAKARLLNIDYSNQIAAFNRSQAVLETHLDGTILAANQNFLQLMGYTLDEVVGRHHRMFVDLKASDEQAYERFWESCGGEFSKPVSLSASRKAGRRSGWKAPTTPSSMGPVTFARS